MKRNCYTPTNTVTGEEYKEGFVAMKDARAICNELNAKIGKKCKDWKPVKTVKTVKYYNSHVVNHFELESSRYTGLIDAPYTPIEFEVSRMTQVAVVKDYLKSVGWIQMTGTTRKTQMVALSKFVVSKTIKDDYKTS